MPLHVNGGGPGPTRSRSRPGCRTRLGRFRRDPRRQWRSPPQPGATGRGLTLVGCRLSRPLARSRATAASSVPSSRTPAAMSGRPADSGVPAAGPKGSPTVREHNHSASGTIETAATGRSRARCRRPNDKRPRASWAAARIAKKTPAVAHWPRCCRHDCGVDGRAADQRCSQKQPSMVNSPAAGSWPPCPADVQSTTPNRHNPADEDEVGDQEYPDAIAHGLHLEPERRLLLQRQAVPLRAGMAHRVNELQLT